MLTYKGGARIRLKAEIPAMVSASGALAAAPRSALDSDHPLSNSKLNYVGSAVKVEFLHHVLAM